MDPEIADYGSDLRVMAIIDLTHWLSIVLFFLAAFLNVVLIYAIMHHSSMHAGNYYKRTQTTMAVTNILGALTIVLARPAIHLHGGVFFFGGHLRFLPFSMPFVVIILYTYLIIYVQKTIAMASIMIYRIWAMSRRLSSLPSYYLLLVPLAAFFLGVPPVVYHMIEVYPDQATQDICLVRDWQGHCTEDIGHAVRRHLSPGSGFLVSPLQLGSYHNLGLTVSLIIMLMLMMSSLVIVIGGSVWIMKQAGESRDIRLHHQLARALLFQILVPAVFMQVPMASGLIGALLGAKMDLLFMSMPIINSLYTCLDPLVVILSVKSYRRGLAGALRIPLAPGSSTVAPTHDQSRRLSDKSGKKSATLRRASVTPEEMQNQL